MSSLDEKDIEKQKRERQTEIDNIEKKKRELLETRSTLEKEIENAKSQLETTKQAEKQANEKVNEMNQKESSLREQEKENAQKKEIDIEQVEKKVKEAKNEMQNAEKDIETLKNEQEKQKNENKKSTDEEKQKKNELDVMLNVMDNLEALYKTTTNEKNQVENDLKQVNNEIEKSEDECDKKEIEVVELKAKLDLNQEELDMHERHQQALKELKQKMDNGNGINIKEENKKCNEGIEILDERISELSELEKDINKKNNKEEERIEEFESHKTNIQKDIKSKKEKMDQLEGEIIKEKLMALAKVALSGLLAFFTGGISLAVTGLTAVNGVMSAINNVSEASALIDQLKGDIDQLEEALENTKQNLRTARKRVQLNNIEKTKLEKQTQLTAQEKNMFNDRMDVINKDSSRLDSLISNKNIDALRNNEKDLIDRNTKLSTQFTTLTDDLKRKTENKAKLIESKNDKWQMATNILKTVAFLSNDMQNISGLKSNLIAQAKSNIINQDMVKSIGNHLMNKSEYLKAIKSNVESLSASKTSLFNADTTAKITSDLLNITNMKNLGNLAVGQLSNVIESKQSTINNLIQQSNQITSQINQQDLLLATANTSMQSIKQQFSNVVKKQSFIENKS